MSDHIEAVHIHGRVRLERRHHDPAGGKPQCEPVAVLTGEQATTLAAQLRDAVAEAGIYCARAHDEEIRRLEAEIKVRQERLAELRGGS